MKPLDPSHRDVDDWPMLEPLRPDRPGGPVALQDRVVLIQTGPVTVVTFGLFAALGVLVATWFAAARLMQVAGGQASTAVGMLFLVGVLGVVGTRLLALALDWRTLLEAPGRALRKTGFAFQGALLVVVPAMYVYLERLGMNPWLLIDALALALPAGHALGRLGCFTYGCCHGRPTASRFAIRYSNPLSKAIWDGGMHGVGLHPAQLYEAGALIGIFVGVNLFAIEARPAGTVTGLYLGLYGLARLGLEHFRGEPAGMAWRLKSYQWISLGIALAGAGLGLACAGQPLIDWGRPGLSLELGRAVAEHWGILVGNFVLFFAAYGIHGRRVGNW